MYVAAYPPMARAQGFARGDLDTAFPLDDKFLDLRGRLSTELYYAASGVYFHVVAAMWREAERKTALRVVPDAPGLVAELVAVGLLDGEGRVPSRAFANHIGRAKRQRKATSDRQARNRAEKSRDVTRDTPVTHRESQPARVTAPLGTDLKGTETGGSGGDRDSLDTYHELTLYRPWGVFSGDKLKAAINDYGDAEVDAALRNEATVNGDRKTLLDRTLARLARNADRQRDQRKAKPRIVKPTDAERSQALAEVRAEAKLA